MFIEQPAIYLRWLYPHALWRMDPSVKAVYLTFDDGPIPEATPFILDTLAHYGVKATFFVVGDNVRKHPDIFRRIVAEGHRIGNHTYNHIGGLKYLSKNYLKNAEKAQEEIERIAAAQRSDELQPTAAELPQGGGIQVAREEITKDFAINNSNFDSATAGRNSSLRDRWSQFFTPQPQAAILHSAAVSRNSAPFGSDPLFRPPHGWMRHDQYQTLTKHYRVVMWDLVTRDYSRRLTADDVVNNVKRYARNGSIITFHDSLRSIDKLYTALPESLEWLIAQGYEFGVL